MGSGSSSISWTGREQRETQRQHDDWMAGQNSQKYQHDLQMQQYQFGHDIDMSRLGYTQESAMNKQRFGYDQTM